jgi:hypothetical protein
LLGVALALQYQFPGSKMLHPAFLLSSCSNWMNEWMQWIKKALGGLDGMWTFFLHPTWMRGNPQPHAHLATPRPTRSY